MLLVTLIYHFVDYIHFYLFYSFLVVVALFYCIDDVVDCIGCIYDTTIGQVTSM